MEKRYPVWTNEQGVTLEPVAHIKAAQYIVASSVEELIADDVIEVEKTPQEIRAELDRLVQDRYWQLRPEYIDTEPTAQWHIDFGRNQLNVYSFGIETSSEQMRQLAAGAARFYASFPDYSDDFDTIVISDVMPKYVWDTELDFKMHAEADPAARLLTLTPHAFKSPLYRPEIPVTTIEAVVIHELAHGGIDETLRERWHDLGLSWYHAGQPGGRDAFLSDQPGRMTTRYAHYGGVYEDIADSIVGYLLYPPAVSADKLELLQSFDKNLKISPPEITQIPEPQKPSLPQTLGYYVDADLVD